MPENKAEYTHLINSFRFKGKRSTDPETDNKSNLPIKKAKKTEIKNSISNLKSNVDDKFSNRVGKGKTIRIFNEKINVDEKTFKRLTEVKIKNDTKNSRYMKVNSEDRYKSLEKRISRLAEIFHAKTARKDEIQDTKLSSLENCPNGVEGNFIGFVSNLLEGKLDRNTLLFQGCQKISNSAIFKLDFCSWKENVALSLFPGKIIVVRGIVRGNGTLVVNTVFSDFSFEIRPEFLREKIKSAKEMSFMVASGAFTNSLNVSYEKSGLQEFAKEVISNSPSFIVLIGPFLSAENSFVTNGKLLNSFEKIVEELLKNFVNDLKDIISEGLQIFILYSSNDVTSTPFLPQKRLENFSFEENGKEILKNIHFLENPSQLAINGLDFVFNGSDIIFDLLSSDLILNRNSKGKSSRWKDLAENLISQRHLYPLYPTSSVPIDYKNDSDLWLKNPFDFLIWTSPSSKISHKISDAFILREGNSIALYPGHLLSSSGAPGCFAIVNFVPDANKKLSECFRVEIKSI